LKQRDAGHPEGVRLGEQLVATLQQQARVHLEHAERAQARLKLRLARQAIIEFRLDSLLAQQQRLEQE
nr:hypothetical protein [Thiolinea sp.]